MPFIPRRAPTGFLHLPSTQPSLRVFPLRWVARAWSIATILLVAGFIVGEGVQVSPGLEALGFVFFPLGICLGLLLSWWKERAGGTVTLACLLIFYGVHFAAAGRFPAGAGWFVFAAPGLLFLVCGLSERRGTAQAV